MKQRLKDEVFKKFKEFKALIENHSKRRIKTLRIDNGGEYTSKEFESFCKEDGINRELTTPYNPQQNGVVERKNRSIMKEKKYGAPEGSTRVSKKSKPFSSYVALMCDLVDQEPTGCDEAIQKKEWVEAMAKEYKSIMNNDVWDIFPKIEGNLFGIFQVDV